jgi:hypothetical protein
LIVWVGIACSIERKEPFSVPVTLIVPMTADVINAMYLLVTKILLQIMTSKPNIQSFWDNASDYRSIKNLCSNSNN